MIRIYVDADGCPVKNEVYKVAKRYQLHVLLASNKRLTIPRSELFEFVLVGAELDAADNWIAEQVTSADIVVTSDIPLASRCLERGARVLDSKGRVFSRESIGEALASRELSSYLRTIGEFTGGPAPLQKQDRSRFLQRLDDLIQAVLKTVRDGKGR